MPTVSDIKADIMSEFYDFANKRISANDYRQYVQKMQQQYPEEFAQIQQDNTEAKIRKLDELALGKESLPLDATLADIATYASDVVYGSEDEPNVGGIGGLADTRANKLWLSGQAHPNTSLHEGLHLFSNVIDKTSTVESKTGIGIGDELLARSFDLLRAYAEGDYDRVDSTMKYVGNQYNKSDLMKIAFDSLNQFYDSGMLEQDPEAVQEALSYFDKKNQGFISSLLEDPEKLSQIETEFYYGVPVDPEEISNFATLLQSDNKMGFKTSPAGNLMGVVVDLDRTGLEPTIK